MEKVAEPHRPPFGVATVTRGARPNKPDKPIKPTKPTKQYKHANMQTHNFFSSRTSFSRSFLDFTISFLLSSLLLLSNSLPCSVRTARSWPECPSPPCVDCGQQWDWVRFSVDIDCCSRRKYYIRQGRVKRDSCSCSCPPWRPPRICSCTP